MLPFTFRGGGSAGVGWNCGCGCGGDSVGGGVPGMTGHVGGAGGVTRGTGDGAGRNVIGVAGRSVGGNRCGARLAALYLTPRPSARCFDGLARPVVFRVLLLEVPKHVLGAVGSPERQRPLVLFIEPLGVFNLHRDLFGLIGQRHSRKQIRCK